MSRILKGILRIELKEKSLLSHLLSETSPGSGVSGGYIFVSR